MSVLGTKSCMILSLDVILGIWISRNGQPNRDYWQKLPRFTEVEIDFDTPNTVYLSNLYKSAKEIIEPMSAESHGRIPSWLKGTLLRNGPGLFEFRDQKADHVFDGMAMIRRYHLGINVTEEGKSGDCTVVRTTPSINISRRIIDSE